jgi:hypothetical protein
LIDPELTDLRKIWIVCEKSKMNNAEQELIRLTDETMIARCKMRPMDPLEVRFLREHCWGRIKAKENQKSCKANGVAVLKIDSGLLEVKGTQAGREEMIMFLLKLAGQLDCKVRIFGRILFVQF